MIDLSFAWPGSEKAHGVVKAAQEMGWSCLGFTVYFKADSSGLHPVDFEGESSQPKWEQDSKSAPLGLKEAVRPVVYTLTGGEDLVLGFNFVRRVTVFLMDDFKPNSLNRFTDSNEFEVLSVVPTSKRSFQMACESLNCDLINLNYLCYFSSYKLKRGLVNSALQRECFFEVALSERLLENSPSGLSPSDSVESVEECFRRSLPGVLKYVSPKRLVLSSGAFKLRDLLEPDQLLGLCRELFGTLSESDLSCCLTQVPSRCINRGAARRTFGTGVVSFRPQEDLGKSFS